MRHAAGAARGRRRLVGALPGRRASTRTVQPRCCSAPTRRPAGSRPTRWRCAAQLIRGLLDTVSTEARHLVAVSDAAGVLLWSDGHPRMLEAAAAAQLRPRRCVHRGRGGHQRDRHRARPAARGADLLGRALHPAPARVDVRGGAGPRPGDRRDHRRDRRLGLVPQRASAHARAGDRRRARGRGGAGGRSCAARRRSWSPATSSACRRPDGAPARSSRPTGGCSPRRRGAGSESAWPSTARARPRSRRDGAARRDAGAGRAARRRRADPVGGTPRRAADPALAAEHPRARPRAAGAAGGRAAAGGDRPPGRAPHRARHAPGTGCRHRRSRAASTSRPRKPVTVRAEVATLRRVVGRARRRAALPAHGRGARRLPRGRAAARAAVACARRSTRYVGPLLPARAPLRSSRGASALEAALRALRRDGGCNPLQPPSARRNAAATR